MALIPRYVRRFVLAGLAVLSFSRAEVGVIEDAIEKRVVILANASSEDSLKLARHYAEKRGIPVENIVALPMTMAETVSWREFIDTVYQPLQDALVSRGWIEATGSALKDSVGRKKYAILGHRMSYLVTCRGVPLRVEHDEALYAEVKPFTSAVAFRTNRGAVDAELALVARSGYSINAYIPNPLFQKDRPTVLDQNKVVKVSRLDGPGLEVAMALVDHAVEAERRGLIGRAYVDIGGPHPEGDQWMEAVVKQLTALDFDMSVDRESWTIPGDARFDAPALYFGWYSSQVVGPFTRAGFKFPAGAVALHIHSFSAETLNTSEMHWCGPLVARGVTATFGNVYEPYLTFTHHPHLVLRALARGETLGEAAFYALRALSWQCVVIGDPLYRPFKVTFAEQWAKRGELPDAFFPYVILREARRLESGGQPEQALAVLREAQKERPGLAVLESALAERAKDNAADGAKP
jgi:uncharacterized protein (TIGR03790 family)